MEVFKNTPIDIVNHILSYDKRFAVGNYNIVNRLELEVKKYKDINRILVVYAFVLTALLTVTTLTLIIRR